MCNNVLFFLFLVNNVQQCSLRSTKFLTIISGTIYFHLLLRNLKENNSMIIVTQCYPLIQKVKYKSEYVKIQVATHESSGKIG